MSKTAIPVLPERYPAFDEDLDDTIDVNLVETLVEVQLERILHEKVTEAGGTSLQSLGVLLVGVLLYKRIAVWWKGRKAQPPR